MKGVRNKRNESSNTYEMQNPGNAPLSNRLVTLCGEHLSWFTIARWKAKATVARIAKPKPLSNSSGHVEEITSHEGIRGARQHGGSPGANDSGTTAEVLAAELNLWLVQVKCLRSASWLCLRDKSPHDLGLA